jgi:hypothetical protein
LLTLGRTPTDTESRRDLGFLLAYQQELEQAGVPGAQREEQAWAALARSLFARNEFLPVD